MHAEKLTNRKPAYPIFYESNYPCDTQTAKLFQTGETKNIVGKGENHYVQQEQQQAQHSRGQGRYEQVQDGSRQRGRCTQNLLNFYTDE